MAKVSEIDISDAPKHIIIFGAPKAGKTKLALGVAERFNVHLIDMENGFKVAKQLPLEWQARMNLIKVLDTKITPYAFPIVSTLFKMGRIHVCDLHGKSNCQDCTVKLKPFSDLDLSKLTKDDVVIFDSLTQLTISIMSFMAMGKPDDWVPEDWIPFRKMGVYLDMMLGYIQNAPFHVICISHELGTELENGAEKLVPVAGTKNYSRNSAKFFDTVVYCDVQNNKHIAASRSTYRNNVLTGDRMGVDLQRVGDKGLLAIFDGDISPPMVEVPVVVGADGKPVISAEAANLANLLKGA